MGSLFPPGDTKLVMPQVSSTSQSLPSCHKTPQVRLFLPQPPRSTRRRSILSVHRGKFRSGAAGLPWRRGSAGNLLASYCLPPSPRRLRSSQEHGPPCSCPRGKTSIEICHPAEPLRARSVPGFTAPEPQKGARQYFGAVLPHLRHQLCRDVPKCRVFLYPARCSAKRELRKGNFCLLMKNQARSLPWRASAALPLPPHPPSPPSLALQSVKSPQPFSTAATEGEKNKKQKGKFSSRFLFPSSSFFFTALAHEHHPFNAWLPNGASVSKEKMCIKAARNIQLTFKRDRP